MTKLSIIIPSYNEAPFLPRCLSSLKADKNVEVIVINDGSTDGSEEILAKWSNRFRIIHHSTNWGVAMTRNHGISIAEGEYIAFLDADDAMSPLGIENILKTLETRTENVIQFNHYRCDGEECKLSSRYYCSQMDYSLSALPPKWAPVWNKVYKKSFLDEHRIRFPEGQQFDEDREFNLQCLHYEKKLTAVTVPTIMKYFDNEESICHTMTAEKFLRAIDELLNRLAIEDDPQICEIIKRSIIQHLESKNYKLLFGGKTCD